MFGRQKEKSDYSKLSLDDFSDDELEAPEPVDLGDDHNNTNGQLRHEQLMKKQDEGLEMLSQSAERLGKMSMQIHEELGTQNQILDEMENDLDEANQDLDMVTRKTKEFIEFTGGEKNCVVILILAAIAVILLFLIIYT
ncbi:hypothetical protein ACA910_015133 [Epithemia clementina (nom. ined.)]